MTVAYDVSLYQVLRQTLKVERESLCLCSAAIVVQALWPRTFCPSHAHRTNYTTSTSHNFRNSNMYTFRSEHE
jgi:hypothetical protein